MGKKEWTFFALLLGLAVFWYWFREMGAHKEVDAQGIGAGFQVSLGLSSSPYAHFAPMFGPPGRHVYTPNTVGEYLAWCPPQDQDG